MNPNKAVPVTILKDKSEYQDTTGGIKRFIFKEDIMKYAFNNSVSVPEALKDFFAMNKNMSKKQMGLFALYTTQDAHIVKSAINLIHALNIKKDEAHKILVEYFGVSLHDPQMWGASWEVDASMNWPLGTTMPQTRRKLIEWLV